MSMFILGFEPLRSRLALLLQLQLCSLLPSLPTDLIKFLRFALLLLSPYFFAYVVEDIIGLARVPTADKINVSLTILNILMEIEP